MKSTSRYKEYSDTITYKIEAREQDYLFIRESQIPRSGNGLYTAIPLYKDEIISIFKGEFISDKEAGERAANGYDSCFIIMPDGTIMDSMETKCFAKYANDALGTVRTKFKINSEIKLDENGCVCIVACRNILSGEEIFCSYGKKYWNK